jgi:hypothetical protein
VYTARPPREKGQAAMRAVTIHVPASQLAQRRSADTQLQCAALMTDGLASGLPGHTANGALQTKSAAVEVTPRQRTRH